MTDSRNLLAAKNVDENDAAAQHMQLRVTWERGWMMFKTGFETADAWKKEYAEMRSKRTANESIVVPPLLAGIEVDEDSELAMEKTANSGIGNNELDEPRVDSREQGRDQESDGLANNESIKIADASTKESDEPLESFDDDNNDRENELKKSILAALNELDTKFGIGVNEYLMQLQRGYGHLTDAHDAKLFFSFLMVTIAAVYLFAYPPYRSMNKMISKYYINCLLPKNNANVRIVDLRKIIHRNQWIFGHIKTSGKGRTKMKILNELRNTQLV